MKGHGYVTFETNHLSFCQADNAFLVGDALGLAQPMTGEGILPAVLSGKICGLAIAEGQPESYSKRLRNHPVIKDYRVQHSIQRQARKIFKEKKYTGYRKSWLRDRIIVKVFALLFSGKRFPGSNLMAKIVK
jgi:flavin-dependent dehydrogenase